MMTDHDDDDDDNVEKLRCCDKCCGCFPYGAILLTLAYGIFLSGLLKDYDYDNYYDWASDLFLAACMILLALHYLYTFRHYCLTCCYNQNQEEPKRFWKVGIRGLLALSLMGVAFLLRGVKHYYHDNRYQRAFSRVLQANHSNFTADANSDWVGSEDDDDSIVLMAVSYLCLTIATGQLAAFASIVTAHEQERQQERREVEYYAGCISVSGCSRGGEQHYQSGICGIWQLRMIQIVMWLVYVSCIMAGCIWDLLSDNDNGEDSNVIDFSSLQDLVSVPMPSSGEQLVRKGIGLWWVVQILLWVAVASILGSAAMNQSHEQESNSHVFGLPSYLAAAFIIIGQLFIGVVWGVGWLLGKFGMEENKDNWNFYVFNDAVSAYIILLTAFLGHNLLIFGTTRLLAPTTASQEDEINTLEEGSFAESSIDTDEETQNHNNTTVRNTGNNDSNSLPVESSVVGRALCNGSTVVYKKTTGEVNINRDPNLAPDNISPTQRMRSSNLAVSDSQMK